MSDRVIIFDTTLRDGEQALSASLNPDEKLKIALALEELGVDVMEVGFPISSPGDFSAVNIIACAEALKPAENFRIHTFIATSDIHLQTKLHKTFEEVCEMAEHSIKLAKNYTDNVEFSCEDAGRTSVDNLCIIIEKAIAAGATTINIPDTVGYNLPNEFGAKIRATSRTPSATTSRTSSAPRSGASSREFPTLTNACSPSTATMTSAWQPPTPSSPSRTAQGRSSAP